MLARWYDLQRKEAGKGIKVLGLDKVLFTYKLTDLFMIKSEHLTFKQGKYKKKKYCEIILMV